MATSSPQHNLEEDPVSNCLRKAAERLRVTQLEDDVVALRSELEASHRRREALTPALNEVFSAYHQQKDEVGRLNAHIQDMNKRMWDEHHYSTSLECEIIRNEASIRHLERSSRLLIETATTLAKRGDDKALVHQQQLRDVKHGWMVREKAQRAAYEAELKNTWEQVAFHHRKYEQERARVVELEAMIASLKVDSGEVESMGISPSGRSVSIAESEAEGWVRVDEIETDVSRSRLS